MPTTGTRTTKRESAPSEAEVNTALGQVGIPAFPPDSVARSAVAAARLIRDLTATNEAAAEIRDVRLPAAAVADRDAFAAALAAGEKGDPEPIETLAAQSELAKLDRRAAALEVATAEARGVLVAAIDDERSGWLPRLENDVTAQTDRYRIALDEIRQAHAALSTAVAIRDWLSEPNTHAHAKGIRMMEFLPRHLDQYERPLPVVDVIAMLDTLVEEAP